MPRWIECERVTFKYGIGDEFIEVLKTLHKLGLDRTEAVEGRQRQGRRGGEPARCGRGVPARPGRDWARQDVGQDVRWARG